MDSSAIEAFLAVVQCGSLTEAANSLVLSQSTLSHRLAELEREVGVNLIDRGRGLRSLTLTDYGKEFLVLAKRWEALEQDAKRIKERTRNLNLTIGAVDTIHNFVLPPLYHALQKHEVKMNLSFKTYNSTELYLKVDRGEIDVAFSLMDLPMQNIISQKFYSESRVILCKSRELRQDRNLSIKDSFNPDTEIYFQGDPTYQMWYERWRGARGYPALGVDTTQLLLQLLDNPDAWSIVPLCIAKHFVATRPFSFFYLEDPPPERSCYKIQSKYPETSVLKCLEIFDQCFSNFCTEQFISSSD